LQVLDDGRLTDGHGRTVDFKNTVLIMTSNVGSQYIRDLADDEAIRERVLAALRDHFRPEFLNRLDEIVIFHSLTREHLIQIVDIQLRRLRQLLDQRKIEIELSDDAKAKLARDGYDPAYGARPLKRVIQRELQDPLALAILEGRFSEGDRLYVDVRDDEIVFSQRAPAPA
jgi:ATP-dependent Clp protease ATP-binding subunit ClpB